MEELETLEKEYYDRPVLFLSALRVKRIGLGLGLWPWPWPWPWPGRIVFVRVLLRDFLGWELRFAQPIP